MTSFAIPEGEGRRAEGTREAVGGRRSWEKALEKAVGKEGSVLEALAYVAAQADEARRQFCDLAEKQGAELSRVAKDGREGHVLPLPYGNGTVDLARLSGATQAYEEALRTLLRTLLGPERAAKVRNAFLGIGEAP